MNKRKYIVIISILALFIISLPLIKNLSSDTQPMEILCYVSNYDPVANTILIDEIEWILQDDINRINALGLNKENDFPNGFYIYNKIIDNITRKISKDAKLLIIKGAEQVPTDKAGFANRIKEYRTPYIITIKDDNIVKIAERYVP